MPYSITTRDGITINGIPDDLPHDDDSLKQRVAQIRAQGAPGSAPAPDAVSPGPAVKAPTNGYLMGLRDPFDAGAQMLERVLPDSVSTGLNKATNWLADRLPSVFAHVEESPQGVSKLVKAVNADYDKGRIERARTLGDLVTGATPDPGFDYGRLAGNVINPATLALPGGAALNAPRTLGALAMAGARTGAITGLAQPVLNDDGSGGDFLLKKAEQAGAGALGGAILTPAISRAVGAGATAVKAGVNAVRSRLPSAPTQQGMQQAISDALQAQGMSLQDAPQAILDSVARQAREALAAGQQLDPTAAVRRAQFEAVGLTGDAAPTLGQVMRDPMQYANERNLVGVRIRTPNGEGNPLSDRFQAQTQRLQGVFDNAGATGATDRGAAGGIIQDALRAADAPVRGAVDDAYTAARAMNNGRAADLERGTFSQMANRALDEQMLGHALPASVRNLLNDISSGRTPFNVDAGVQIDSMLSRAQRAATRAGDDNAALAVGRVREALHATPLAGEGQGAAAAGNGVEDAVLAQSDAPQLGAPIADRTVPSIRAANAVGQVLPQGSQRAAAGLEDNGANAREAFNQARRAARDRFATIEQTPALRAALDDNAPDRFVQQYILNAPARDVEAMRNVLQNSPEALAQARAQIADHLKRAAFGNNASGDGGFAAERYLNTLRSLGRDKLSVFFSPEEIVRFNLAGKVMSDIGSIPAGARGAVNTSGTAGAMMNLLSQVAENPMLRRIPFGRAIANQVGEMQTESAMNRALAGQAVAPNPGTQLSPQTLGAIRLLFAPSAALGGALGGQAAQ